jgi:hypothetical protein
VLGQQSQSAIANVRCERCRKDAEAGKNVFALKTAHDGLERMLPPARACEQHDVSPTAQRIDYFERRQVASNDQRRLCLRNGFLRGHERQEQLDGVRRQGAAKRRPGLTWAVRAHAP